MGQPDFDPAGFYRAMDESESLQVSADETRWMHKYAEPGRAVDAVLAFGCAVLHTPHLMREAVGVFEALGVDFAAVTGRQFCCARPFERGGLPEAADRIATKSYERFTAFRPSVTVQWCGACMLQYLEVISKQADPPFDVVHVTAYIAQKLKDLGDQVPWKQPVRSKVVLHSHSDHTQQGTDASKIIEILQMIPGVEYVGPLSPPSVGAPCNLAGPTHRSILTDLTTAEYRAAQAELEAQALAVGADTLVTPYHACQREWSKFSSDRMAVREWMSVLAEALGCGVEDRFQTYWKLADPEAVVERSRAAWESRGLNEDEAIDRARRHFVPAYSVHVQHCDCGNGGCGSCGAQLVWPAASGG